MILDVSHEYNQTFDNPLSKLSCSAYCHRHLSPIQAIHHVNVGLITSLRTRKKVASIITNKAKREASQLSGLENLAAALF